MPIFSYEAKKGPKEIVKGRVEADGEDRAVDKVTQMGYVPIRVVAIEEDSASQAPPASAGAKQGKAFRLFKKVRSRDLTIFMEQLASLIKSKVPLLEAIRVLVEQTENKYLQQIISDVQSEIRDGKSLSQSIAKHPDAFPPLYVNMIASGEAGGVLEQTLTRLVEFRNKQEEIRSKVNSSLAYPIFILIVGVATVFILLGFVIPKMGSLFDEIGQTLPLSTRMLLLLSEKVKHYWYWAVAAVVALIFVLKGWRPTKGQRIFLDSLRMKLPLVGDFTKKSVIARFSRTLAILLANGIPLFQAIRITIPTIDSEIFKSELNSLHKDISEGMSLEQGIKNSSWVPSYVSNMLAVGERGGNLEEALSEVANLYERDVDKSTKMMTSLFEPVIILAMGLVVGFIVFAMLLPIFQINLGIR